MNTNDLRNLIYALGLTLGLGNAALANDEGRQDDGGDVGRDDGASDVGQDDGGTGDDGRDDGNGDGDGGQDDGTDDGRDDGDEAPADVTLRGIAYAGTGCPANTIRHELPTDGKAFLIFWEGFAAEAGPNIPLRETRKNCQLNLDIEYPSGWQYTVESISYNGRVRLQDDVGAVASSAFYFQGDAVTARSSTAFTGGIDEDYSVVDVFQVDDGQDAPWSPCEATRSLNVNVSVRVDASSSQNGYGRISFADGEGAAPSLLVLKWRRCESDGQ